MPRRSVEVAWKRCTGCDKVSKCFSFAACPLKLSVEDCRSNRKVLTTAPIQYARRRNYEALPTPEHIITMTEDQIERAARFMARAEGWNPDGLTGKQRPIWQVYAEQIRDLFLPSVTHALAGVSEGNASCCPAEPSLPLPVP